MAEDDTPRKILFWNDTELKDTVRANSERRAIEMKRILGLRMLGQQVIYPQGPTRTPHTFHAAFGIAGAQELVSQVFY